MQVTNFKTNDKTGIVKGTFVASFPSTDYGDWNVNITLFQKDDGTTWFGYPQREYIDKEGQKKYFKLSYPSRVGRDGFEKDLRNTLCASFPEAQTIFAKEPVKEVEDIMPF